MNKEFGPYQGHDSVTLTTVNGTKMVVVTDWGPRIASFRSPEGMEFMFQDPERKINRGNWHIGGGGRVWTYRGTGADETEESYAPDENPCIVGEDSGVMWITGAADPVFSIQRGFAITENEHGGFDVTSFVRNTSDQMLWSGGVWAIAAVDPCCFILIPTGSPYQSNWHDTTYNVVWKWAGHQTTAKFVSEQVKIMPGILGILPGNEEGKLMVQSPAGAIWAQKQQSAFVKIARWQPALADKYPAGCNLAVYSSPGMVFRESETMGPECPRLEAGEELKHTERWVALDSQEMPWEKAAPLHELIAKLR